jgi:predicted regulator of Ras-like GTPase activity (Roadblock/LC7/MglB family)
VPFTTIIKELMSKTPGASGVILADWEGEAVVHECLYDDYDLKIIGAHGGILLNLMKELHHQFADQGLRDVVIATERLQLFVGAVGPEYTLIMTLDRDASYGEAIFRFRRALKLLEKEIY